jgi:transcription initiation factor IIF auxiliary subunit
MARVYDYVDVLTKMQEAVASGAVYFEERGAKNESLWAYLHHMRRVKNKRRIRDDVESIEAVIVENQDLLRSASLMPKDVVKRRKAATLASVEALAQVKQTMMQAAEALTQLKQQQSVVKKEKRKKKKMKHYFTAKKYRVLHEEKRRLLAGA